MAASLDVADLATQLGSLRRIDRDKAVEQLRGHLSAACIEGNAEDMARTLEPVLTPMLEQAGADISGANLALTQAGTGWEAAQGALMAGTLLADKELASEAFVEALATSATKALSSVESRLRLQGGVTLGVLCRVYGMGIYSKYAEAIIVASIRDNLEARRDEAAALLKAQLSKGKDGAAMTAEEIFHESAGWKTLETGCRALLEIVKETREAFLPFISSSLLDIVFASLTHTNRFVRETSFYVCGELSDVLLRAGEEAMTKAGITRSEFTAAMAPALATGLADNWSQCRMAAAVASRRFLMAMPPAEREALFHILLPRLLLNRMYIAEGVRLYSQETWRELVGERGRDLVAEHIDVVVAYYQEQAQAENHAVREAALQGIAELGAKIDPERVKPHVTALMAVLLEAFLDESWPVRQTACVASGRFVHCHPEECRSYLDDLFTHLFAHVCDAIWSVRRDAAIALGELVQAYGDEAYAVVEKKIEDFLPAVKDQAAASTKNAGLENTTTFGVAAPASPAADGGVRRIVYRPGDLDEAHTNKQTYSCGSLAPKLKRKGGCMDCGYHREPEPWERSDGAVYLLAELAAQYPRLILNFVPTLVEISQLHHYTHHHQLLENIWKQLPTIAKGVGKKEFKRHLESFVPALHYSLRANNNLAKAAAQGCCQQLSKLLGASIFRGRIEILDPSLLPDFEAALAAPPVAAGGRGGEDAPRMPPSIGGSPGPMQMGSELPVMRGIPALGLQPVPRAK